MLILIIGLLLFAAQLETTVPAEPARAPQLAANGSMAGLTFGAENQIFFRASSDSGRTFGPAIKVADAEVVPLNRHRGPHIAFSGRSIVITAVMGKTTSQETHAHGLPSDGDLLAWRSVDGGRHWSRGVVVNDVPGAAAEGLHALAGDASGHLDAAWLDKRSAGGTRIFGARSDDGGASWSKNTLVYSSPDGTVCECCHPSAGIDANGQILVMWRNWLGGSRDMYLARSQDGVTFSKAEKIGNGTWQLNACPMDGGGLAVDHGRAVSAWRRDRTVYVAESGAVEMAVGEGRDVTLTVGARGIYTAWVGPAGVVVLRPASAHPDLLSASGAVPVLVPLADGTVLAAWEDNGVIKTMRVN